MEAEEGRVVKAWAIAGTIHSCTTPDISEFIQTQLDAGYSREYALKMVLRCKCGKLFMIEGTSRSGLADDWLYWWSDGWHGALDPLEQPEGEQA